MKSTIKIIEGIASKINYDFFENDEYKNAVEIKIESQKKRVIKDFLVDKQIVTPKELLKLIKR